MYDTANVGKNPDVAVAKYSSSVRSWEKRLMPAADKLAKMGATVKDIPEIPDIDAKPARMLPDE